MAQSRLKKHCSNWSKKRGMTLVEILMCCFILAMVTAMIFKLFKNQTSVFKTATQSQQLQESVRRLIMYLDSDIKMSHFFETVEDKKLIFTIFNAPPDISDTTDPAITAKTVKCEYSYDEATRTLTRTVGTIIKKFEDITPEILFKPLSYNTETKRLITFDFDPTDGNHKIIGIKLSVKAASQIELGGRSTDFKLVRKFFSRNRNNNFFYGPEKDSAGNSTGRKADATNEFNKHIGYFSTVDCDPSY